MGWSRWAGRGRRRAEARIIAAGRRPGPAIRPLGCRVEPSRPAGGGRAGSGRPRDAPGWRAGSTRCGFTNAASYEPVRSNALPDIHPRGPCRNSVNMITVPTHVPASAARKCSRMMMMMAAATPCRNRAEHQRAQAADVVADVSRDQPARDAKASISASICAPRAVKAEVGAERDDVGPAASTSPHATASRRRQRSGDGLNAADQAGAADRRGGPRRVRPKSPRGGTHRRRRVAHHRRETGRSTPRTGPRGEVRLPHRDLDSTARSAATARRRGSCRSRTPRRCRGAARTTATCRRSAARTSPSCRASPMNSRARSQRPVPPASEAAAA